MERKGLSNVPSRRQLLLQVLPAGAFTCLLCRHGLAATGEEKGAPAAPAKHKFQEPCGMTYEQLFQFSYGQAVIPVMTALAAETGREKLVEMLKKASSAAAVEEVREGLKKNPKNDLATYTAEIRNPSPLFKNALTYKLVENTPTAVEMGISECLWAKTFREADAADIGYALACHSDFATTAAFNPKIELTRTKTLMQGHEVCNPRWVMKA